MVFFTLRVVIEKEPGDDGYAAYSPSLPGCFSRGQTVEETKKAIRTALSTRLQELVSRGEPLPKNRKFIHVEDVTIGLEQRDRPAPKDDGEVSGTRGDRPSSRGSSDT